jgi:Icc-related predicted phosphoesterase
MRFKRRSTARRMRIVFATDLHGSEACFRKWVNAARVLEASCLVMGGDITGKSMVPIVQTDEGWVAELGHDRSVARDDEELAGLRKRIRAGGRYDVEVTREELDRLAEDADLRDRLFKQAIQDSLRRWIEVAEERLPATGTPAFFMLGNDDEDELLDGIGPSDALQYGEDRVCELPGGYEMISFGYSTPTPWNTPRELSEERMAEEIERQAAKLSDRRRAVYNLHCPPRDTHLDQAAILDDQMRPKQGAAGTMMGSVGSSAVREAIERDEPLLGLHGHVHECSAVQRLGGTLCVNAGSEYQSGVLKLAILELDDGEVKNWQLMSS